MLFRQEKNKARVRFPTAANSVMHEIEYGLWKGVVVQLSTRTLMLIEETLFCPPVQADFKFNQSKNKYLIQVAVAKKQRNHQFRIVPEHDFNGSEDMLYFHSFQAAFAQH